MALILLSFSLVFSFVLTLTILSMLHFCKTHFDRNLKVLLDCVVILLDSWVINEFVSLFRFRINIVDFISCCSCCYYC